MSDSYQIYYNGKKIIFSISPFGSDCGTKIFHNLWTPGRRLGGEEFSFLRDVVEVLCGVKNIYKPGNWGETRKIIGGGKIREDETSYDTIPFLLSFGNTQTITTPSAHDEWIEYIYAVVVLSGITNEELNTEIYINGITRKIVNGRLIV